MTLAGMSAVSTGEPFVAHTSDAVARVWGNVSVRRRWGASISMATRRDARPSGKSPNRYLNCRNVPAMFASASGPVKSYVDRASSGLIPSPASQGSGYLKYRGRSAGSAAILRIDLSARALPARITRSLYRCTGKVRAVPPGCARVQRTALS